MEVLIKENNMQISAWFQYSPSIATESIEIKPKMVKIKRNKRSRNKNSRMIIPRISINRVKAKAYTSLGTSIGAILGNFRIN